MKFRCLLNTAERWTVRQTSSEHCLERSTVATQWNSPQQFLSLICECFSQISLFIGSTIGEFCDFISRLPLDF